MLAAPTCIALEGNNLQLDTTSTWKKIQVWFNVDTDVVQMLSVLWRHKKFLIEKLFTVYCYFKSLKPTKTKVLLV